MLTKKSSSVLPQLLPTQVMMKSITLLMAIIAAITIHGSHASSHVACYTYYTRGQKGTYTASPKLVFTGITPVGTPPTYDKYDNPLYYSLAAAKTGFTKQWNRAKGRFSGSLPYSTNTGTMTFTFFNGPSTIKIKFKKSTTATSYGTILSGTKCYSKATGGTAVRTTVWTSSGTPPTGGHKVFKWVLCPNKPRSCTP